jgi:hypothetical protein
MYVYARPGGMHTSCKPSAALQLHAHCPGRCRRFGGRQLSPYMSRARMLSTGGPRKKCPGTSVRAGRITATQLLVIHHWHSKCAWRVAQALALCSMACSWARASRTPACHSIPSTSCSPSWQTQVGRGGRDTVTPDTPASFFLPLWWLLCHLGCIRVEQCI